MALPWVAHHLWIHQLPFILGGPPVSLVVLDGIYLDLCQAWMMSAWRAHSTPVQAPGHTTAQGMLRAHTSSNTCGKLHRAVHVKQLSRGCACTCKKGCIKHERGASQGADLTLLNLPQDPAPLKPSPLGKP